MLIVCTANICRSPTAETVLRHRLDGAAVEVESAGLAALPGTPIDPRTEAVLAAHGLSAAGHVARRATPAQIAAADLVLAMEQRHLSALRALVPSARARSFLLGRWQGNADIPDPYGRAQDAYEEAYRMIEAAVEDWRARL